MGPADDARLIVGLGNPGKRYERTRHNVGFRVIDALADRWMCSRSKAAFGGQLGEATTARGADRVKVWLFKPETFMNASGRAVGEVMRFYKLPIENVLVVYDDLALPLGKLRARADGSAGGHKGLADIIQVLGTNVVPRLRVGIDAPPVPMKAEDYVLGKFTKDDEVTIKQAIAKSTDAVETWLFDGLQRVMDTFNSSAPDDAG
jgi:peptidyl-tRNA hydrolase, PTH1 family